MPLCRRLCFDLTTKLRLVAEVWKVPFHHACQAERTLPKREVASLGRPHDRLDLCDSAGGGFCRNFILYCQLDDKISDQYTTL